MDIIENQKHRSMNDLANAIACYFELYSSTSPVAMSKFLTEEGFVRRAKANLIAPTYIQGRKFDKIFHCTACNGIPYGGVGEDSHFCMVCGAEIEEIVNGI